MEFLGWLIVGVALGAGGAWAVLRARRRTASADQTAESERARAEAAAGRAEAAQARAEAARTALDVAIAQTQAAEARAGESAAQAELADAQASARAAVAERDAATIRAREITEDRAQLLAQLKVFTVETTEHHQRQLEAAADQRLKVTDQLMTPVRDSLQRFEDRLTQVEKERVSIATDLRSQVDQVRLTGESLRRETAALVTALRKPQVRGAWGEMQLQRVVELAGMVEHCDFVLQETNRTTTGSTIRPDLKVMLSADRFLYVDSKVPLSAFLDAHEASDKAERTRLLSQFGKNVQTHVDQLSAKEYYKVAGATPEFVVLFLASEALAAEAFHQLPSLHEYASDRDVVIATPTSLIALLKTIGFAWRQASLAESAQEVFGLGRELYGRLATVGKHVDKLGRSLTGAVAAYNETVGSLESRVLPTARRLRELKVTAKELATLEGSHAAVRPLSAPEFVGELIEDPLADNHPADNHPADNQLADDLQRSAPELVDLIAADVTVQTRQGDEELAS